MTPALRTFIAVIAVIPALSLVACDSAGESKENRAQSIICDARADIATQIETLQGLGTGETTVEEAQKAARKIRADISSIRTAQQDLGEERLQEVREARAEFATAVRSALRAAANGDASAPETKQQLSSAADDVQQAYEESLKRIDCGD